MSFRLAGACIAAALSLVACGVTPPTAAPAATSQTASTDREPMSSPSTRIIGPAAPPSTWCLYFTISRNASTRVASWPTSSAE